MKKAAFVIYAWGSTILYIVFIVWLATVTDFQLNDTSSELLTKIVIRISMYALLLILIYRSLIASFRSTITRLSKWRSSGEKHDDIEFVYIIETLLMVISSLSAILVSIYEEWVQRNTYDENIISHSSDVLISILAIALTSLVLYVLPAIGEFEIAIKNYLSKKFKDK